jgi:hypothetical protein
VIRAPRQFTDEQHRIARSNDPGRGFVKTYKGIATVRACPFCKYFEKVNRRLNRFAYYDGGLHSKVAGHIRREHADIISAIRAEAEALTAGKNND